MSVIARRRASPMVFAMAACLSACQPAATAARVDLAPPPHRVSATDAKGVIELAVGQLLEVPLSGNASTGYGWDRIGAQAGVLVDAGSEGLPSSTPASREPGFVGAGGTTVFRYRAARAGQETLQLVYRRAWDKDIPPAETVMLTVLVH